ncbi:hypothetical protein NH44784_027741 [Achromobacter xylosoxidans NH44784-1996]|uniref:ParB/Srx family N-terminal domain-containing protein n=1 Tax=Alcaligenes xylosoxydans xylosoxydans TaxID=85698 RepID=UPI0003321DA5|nr:ParB/Srx family N-terminal domain-containing protein [Achromobacter xylosoxidans]CCH06737.1 hypothetical protein NH44784_027741 [Achromobacter xylosoxidans NH44784-1996]
MAKKETLNVTQLDLDIENPRTTAEDNQTDALRSLLAVEREGEKVYELARDICEAGMIDPGDRLYVVQSNSKDRFTVLDGNRRLAALRLLSQPSLIERDDIGLSPSLQSRFKRLQSEHANRWPTEVDVVIFEDRDQANRFIRLRHTGENLGAGRSAWSALQIARFDNTGLWQCLESLRAARELSLAVLNELDRSAFNITSFERVVASDEFQRRFGCRIGKNTFSVGVNPSSAMKALARVANDVANGRVTSRGDFAEAKTMLPYIDEVEAAITVQSASDTSPSPQPQPTAMSDNGTSLPTSKPPPARPGTPPPSALPPSSTPISDVGSTTVSLPPVRKKRVSKFLLSKHELSNVTNSKCREIVIELKQKVSVQDAPYACALLLRCLQELTAEIYVRDVIGRKPTDRSANIEAAAKHLLGNPHPTDTSDKLDIAKNFDQFRGAYEELSSAAHSKVTDLSSDHLRSTWNNLGGGMDLLWKRIHAAEIARSQEVTA